MKKFLLRLLLITLIFFVVDKVFLLVEQNAPSLEFDRRIEKMMDGEINADIIVFGSSRSAKSIITSSIADSLGQTAYNLSYNGSNLDFHEFMIRMYLKHNKKGKIYLKMDVYNETLKQEIIYSKKWIFQKFHKLKEQSFLKKIAVVSAENPISLDLLKQRFPILENKAILVTNGINVDFISKAFPQPKSFEEKENIILSVGRIGAEEKNYKMLMDSILGCDLNDWKLVLVGPIENNFDSYVEQKIKEHPHLKGKIELVGNVEDRVALYQYYNRSKIFCLTSPFESFGIAFIEAMYFGNYIIGTDGMSSFDYISNDLELGSRVSVNDEEALTLQLNELIIHPEKMEETYSKVQQQVAEKFYWSEIIKNLEEVLSK